MDRKVSLSIFNLQERFGDIRALEIAKEIGCDAVDFNLDGSDYDVRNPNSIYSKPEEEFVAYFTQLKEKADSLGLAIAQTHGRGSIFRYDEDFNKAVVENARLDCYATKLLGAPVTVFHTVSNIATGPDADWQWMRDTAFERNNTFLKFAKQYGVMIATETFGDAPDYGICNQFGYANEFLESYNRIASHGDNGNYFKICVDTGHSNKAYRFGNPTAAEVIRMCGSNIVALHLNDNDTLTDQHKIPMTGSIDWNDVFDALDEVGYQGYYNMELNLMHFGKSMMQETAAFAVKLMKDILRRRYGK